MAMAGCKLSYINIIIDLYKQRFIYKIEKKETWSHLVLCSFFTISFLFLAHFASQLQRTSTSFASLVSSPLLCDATHHDSVGSPICVQAAYPPAMSVMPLKPCSTEVLISLTQFLEHRELQIEKIHSNVHFREKVVLNYFWEKSEMVHLSLASKLIPWLLKLLFTKTSSLT